MGNGIRAISFLAAMAGVIAVLTPGVAFAAGGALSNGTTHTGVIPVGGLDTWTFTAARNDSITTSVGEVAGSDAEPYFSPWIRLRGPDGASVGEDRGNGLSANIDVRAPLPGIYTLLVAGYSGSGYPNQQGAGTYSLTMAKTPGPYDISPGDEGGAMSDTTQHAGIIAVGDLDTWTFTAGKNDSITASVGEVAAGGPEPFFSPWIRLRGPDGASLAHDTGNGSSAQIDLRAPLTGIYTLLVAGYSGNGYPNQQEPGRYILTGSGLRPPGFSVAGILAVVGSLQGNGAFFRTRIQIHNAGTSPISGKFVFHDQGVSGNANDRSLPYALSAGETIDYPDILPAMGVSGGLGSLDIMTTGDPVPIMAARIFSDAGSSGTAGFFLEPVAPGAALQAGDGGVIVAPPDPQQARLNLGIRSLDTGASFVITVRNKSGVVRRTTTKTYLPNFFEQVSANPYLGVSLDGSDTITFSMSSGQAIIYGAQTDNRTQDPSVQYAKKLY